MKTTDCRLLHNCDLCDKSFSVANMARVSTFSCLTDYFSTKNGAQPARNADSSSLSVPTAGKLGQAGHLTSTATSSNADSN